VLLLPNISNPFYGKVIKGIQGYCRVYDYTIVLCDSGDGYACEEQAINILLSNRLDCLIIAPIQKQRTDITELTQNSVPFLLLRREFAGLQAKCVLFDDVAGARLATEHLLTTGCRRSLFLGGPPYISKARLRHREYKQALASFGVPADLALFRMTEPELNHAYRAMRGPLTQALKFDALYTFDDIVAAGVMKALIERRIRVPEDVALVGNDDIELASILQVPLTTIRLPRYEMGKRAAEMVIAASRNAPSDLKERLMLKPELVVRSST